MSNLPNIFSAALPQEEIQDVNLSPSYFQENSQPSLNLSELIKTNTAAKIDQESALKLKKICESHFPGSINDAFSGKSLPIYFQNHIYPTTAIHVNLLTETKNVLEILTKNKKHSNDSFTSFFIRFLSDPRLPAYSLSYLLSVSKIIFNSLFTNHLALGFEEKQTPVFYFKQNETLFSLSYDYNLSESLAFFKNSLQGSFALYKGYSDYLVEFFQLLNQNNELNFKSLATRLSYSENLSDEDALLLWAWYKDLQEIYFQKEYNSHLLFSLPLLNILYSYLTLILIPKYPKFFTAYGINQQLCSFYNCSTNFPILSEHREICAYLLMLFSLNKEGQEVEHLALYDGSLDLWLMLVQNPKKTSRLEQLTELIFDHIPKSRINEILDKFSHYLLNPFFDIDIFIIAAKKFLGSDLDFSQIVPNRKKSDETSTIFFRLLEIWISLLKKIPESPPLQLFTADFIKRSPKDHYSKIILSLVKELESYHLNMACLVKTVHTFINSFSDISNPEDLLELAYQTDSINKSCVSGQSNHFLFEILMRLNHKNLETIERCLFLGLKAGYFQNKISAEACCEKLASVNYPFDKFLDFFKSTQLAPASLYLSFGPFLSEKWKEYAVRQLQNFDPSWLKVDYPSFHFCLSLIKDLVDQSLKERISKSQFSYLKALIKNHQLFTVEHILAIKMHSLNREQERSLKKALIKEAPTLSLVEEWLEQTDCPSEKSFSLIERLFQKYFLETSTPPKKGSSKSASNSLLNLSSYLELLLRSDLAEAFAKVPVSRLYALYWGLTKYLIDHDFSLQSLKGDFWKKFIELSSLAATEADKNCHKLCDHWISIAKMLSPNHPFFSSAVNLLKGEILAGLEKFKYVSKKLDLLRFFNEYVKKEFISLPRSFWGSLLSNLCQNLHDYSHADLNFVLQKLVDLRSFLCLSDLQTKLESVIQFGKSLRYIPPFMIDALSLTNKGSPLPKEKLQGGIEKFLKNKDCANAQKLISYLKDVHLKTKYVEKIYAIYEEQSEVSSSQLQFYMDFHNLLINRLEKIQKKVCVCISLMLETKNSSLDLLNAYAMFKIQDIDLLFRILKLPHQQPLALENLSWPTLFQWILLHPHFSRQEIQQLIKDPSHLASFIKDPFWIQNITQCLLVFYSSQRKKEWAFFPAEALINLLLYFSENDPSFANAFFEDFWSLRNFEDKTFFLKSSLKFLKIFTKTQRFLHFHQSVILIKEILSTPSSDVFLLVSEDDILGALEKFDQMDIFFKNYRSYPAHLLKSFPGVKEISNLDISQFYSHYIAQYISILKLIWEKKPSFSFYRYAKTLLSLTRKETFFALKENRVFTEEIKRIIEDYLQFTISSFFKEIVINFTEFDRGKLHFVFHEKNAHKALATFSEYAQLVKFIQRNYGLQLSSLILDDHLKISHLFNELHFQTNFYYLNEESFYSDFDVFLNFFFLNFEEPLSASNSISNPSEAFLTIKKIVLSYLDNILLYSLKPENLNHSQFLLESFFKVLEKLPTKKNNYWIPPCLYEACLEKSLKFYQDIIRETFPNKSAEIISELICQLSYHYAVLYDFEKPTEPSSTDPYSKFKRIEFFKKMVTSFPLLYNFEFHLVKKIFGNEYSREEIFENNNLFNAFKKVHQNLYQSSIEGKTISFSLSLMLHKKIQDHFQAECSKSFPKNIPEILREDLIHFQSLCKTFLFFDPVNTKVKSPPDVNIIERYQKIFSFVSYDPLGTGFKYELTDFILDIFEALNMYRLFFDSKFHLPNEIIFEDLDPLSAAQKERVLKLRKLIKKAPYTTSSSFKIFTPPKDNSKS